MKFLRINVHPGRLRPRSVLAKTVKAREEIIDHRSEIAKLPSSRAAWAAADREYRRVYFSEQERIGSLFRAKRSSDRSRTTPGARSARRPPTFQAIAADGRCPSRCMVPND